MAIRKDLDDMLNNLKATNEGNAPAKKAEPAVPPVHKPNSAEEKINHMSVDDLLSTLSHEKEAPVQTALAPAPVAPAPATAPAPEPVKKKRIVISGDLPDYEAIRQAELAKDRAAAEQKRLEAERMAAAREAEIRRAEAERKAAEEAERQRLEAAKKAAEEAERQRLEAAKKAEEADRQRLEAAKKAAEEAAAAKSAFAKKPAAPVEAPESADNSYSFEEEINVVVSSQTEDSLGGGPSVDELMAAAFAAVKAEAEEIAEAPEEAEEVPEEETDPVGSMIDTIREDAEKKLSELDEATAPEEEAPAEEPADEPESSEETAEPEEDEVSEAKKRFEEMKKADAEAAEAEGAEKPKGKITAALEKIMEEDPDEIIAERSEKVEDNETTEQGGRLKKRLYTIFGIVFAVLACVGLITVIATAGRLFGKFTSGDSKKTGFADVVYPVVIMDIESFDEPSQLTSDQVITAAIWSMIMSDGTLDQYEKTFDVVRVPAVDVESYAVKLFGDDLPELTHTTVGPAESRFYYNEEKESYNIPLTPVTFTYSPEIKSVTKSGNEYTLVVDYIDELPEWLPKTSSKSVQFKLAETSEGYQIKAMKVLAENNNI